MRSAKDVAILAVQEAFGLTTWERATFVAMLGDKGETGASLRRAVDAVERAIDADRKLQASMLAAS